jgi:energy-converting hydrogenase Eha subunit F
MGTADMITDILLVAFPIPIVLRSQIPLKRKLSLVCLFSFSVGLVVITGLRMPNVINHHGRQQYRTVWASAEILASAAVSNAIILGTFVKDRGVKKNKYRPGATLDTISRADTRRATLESIHRDSEEALFREMGVRMPESLCVPKSSVPRPAPVALSPTSAKAPYTREYLMSPANISDTPPSPHDSADALRKPSDTAPSTATGQSVSFFDVGGLLGSGEPRHGSSGTTAQDFAFTGPRTPGLPRPTQDTLSGDPSPTRTRSQRNSIAREQQIQNRNSTYRQREDSNTLSLSDIGGLLGGSLPNQPRRDQQEPVSPTTRAPSSIIPPDDQAPRIPASMMPRRTRPESANLDLQDVGGLSK